MMCHVSHLFTLTFVLVRQHGSLSFFYGGGQCKISVYQYTAILLLLPAFIFISSLAACLFVMLCMATLCSCFIVTLDVSFLL